MGNIDFTKMQIKAVISSMKEDKKPTSSRIEDNIYYHKRPKRLKSDMG